MEGTLTSAFRPRFPHSLIVKVPDLLPMFYTVPDLVENTGVSVGAETEWKKSGLPHQRDSATAEHW